MTNLMCRGRKRGLAGNHRHAASGQTGQERRRRGQQFPDGDGRFSISIDAGRRIARHGTSASESFRDLLRGQFIGLGPALARRPLPIRIGGVETAGHGGTTKLVPLPETSAESRHDLLFSVNAGEPMRYSAGRPAPLSTQEVLRQLQSAPVAKPAPPVVAPNDQDAAPDMPCDILPEAMPDALNNEDSDSAPKTVTFRAIIQSLLAMPDSAYRTTTALHQDFLIHCREHKLNGRQMAMVTFKREVAMARPASMNPRQAIRTGSM